MLVIDNGITLCFEHHRITKGREHEYAEFFANLINKQLVALPSPNRKDRTPLVITKEELQQLYWNDELGTPEIGVIKGVTGACVLKHMARHNIPRRSQLEVAWLR
jgi:hypothetical protein